MAEIKNIDDHISEIKKFIKGTGYAKMSGSLFYSTRDTLKQGLIYLLGINPGGEPNHTDPTQSIKENIFPKSVNAYYEKWENYPPGEHPFQLNVKQFLNSLISLDDAFQKNNPDNFIKNICCSNLCFVRSSSTNKINIKDHIIWDIHSYIINNIVKPSIIIINGITAYKIFRHELGQSGIEENLETGKRSKVRIVTYDNDKLLVGIPHLSGRRGYAKFLDNEIWKQAGLPVFIKKCKEVKTNRKEEGCEWFLNRSQS